MYSCLLGTANPWDDIHACSVIAIDLAKPPTTWLSEGNGQEEWEEWEENGNGIVLSEPRSIEPLAHVPETAYHAFVLNGLPENENARRYIVRMLQSLLGPTIACFAWQPEGEGKCILLDLAGNPILFNFPV